MLGTGVAGLASIQTAVNMGAVVKAFDVRPTTKEQVEAMGGQFLKVSFFLISCSKKKHFFFHINFFSYFLSIL